MEKYEFNIKVEQIKKMVSRGDYETAMRIADAIDWRRVRNAGLLSMVSEIYEKNREYGEARTILLLAFERAPISKRMLYKLADLALKEGDVAEAEAYYKEFCELAPEDPRQYLLRYLILKEKNASLEQMIRALETYTAKEMDEKWLYELAVLYHKAGQKERCVSTCDMIILLFGIGKYVEKATVLKQEYVPVVSQPQEPEVQVYEQVQPQSVMYQQVQPQVYEQPQSVMYQQVQPEINPEMELQIQEQAESKKLAQEVLRFAQEAQPEPVEENPMEATRMLNDLHDIKDIIPTRRVIDIETEREEAERELMRQRAAIRAAREREEMEAEALRRAEAEREAARREEEERHTRMQAEIDRERALRQKTKMLVSEESEEEEILFEIKEWNHLMVEARTPEEGFALAIDALKKIHRELGYKNQVAKINSERLNIRGIFAVKEKLAGRDLMIEHAAGLTESVQEELNELIEQDATGMIVVFIDTAENLKNLHMHNPSLTEKFQYIGTAAEDAAVEAAILKEAQIQEQIARDMVYQSSSNQGEYRQQSYETPSPKIFHQPDSYPVMENHADTNAEPVAEQVMTAEQFAKFACQYAAEIDCSITGKSMLALSERIEMMEEDGIHLTQKAAIDLIEDAADKAEKQSLGRKFTSLISPAYNKEGLLILREKDFFD